MLLTIAIVLLVIWVLGAFVARLASGLIHLLVIVALVFFVLHFVRGRRAGFVSRPVIHERHYRD